MTAAQAIAQEFPEGGLCAREPAKISLDDISAMLGTSYNDKAKNCSVEIPNRLYGGRAELLCGQHLY